MIKAKKLTAIILAIIMIATTFISCSTSKNPTEITKTPVNEESEGSIPLDDTTFKLSYTQSDSLNPFESTTLNNQVLFQLVFESLFDLDDNFKSNLNIASSYEYTDKYNLKVTIKSGLLFSDKSTLTSDDIVYSFNSAKKSPYWANYLIQIDSCSAVSSNVVNFRLHVANNYAQNLLTFPIISKNSAKSTYPIGNGRYYFANEDIHTVLKANPQSEFKPYLTTIHLENITSSDSIDNAVNIGNISFAYRDLSEGATKKISANKKLVNTNNLVFIGINGFRPALANPYVRKAISLAVDRETLVRSAYSNFAQTATTVFNPQFELSSTQLFEKNADVNAARQALYQSGNSRPQLSLIVNGDNSERVTCAKLITQELNNVGFKIKLFISNNFQEYCKWIVDGKYDLYLGETKITPDMSLTSFLTEKGSTSFGIDFANSICAQSYYGYLDGSVELGKFLIDFSSEMPFVPLLYKKGMICFTKAMNGDMQGNAFDCFANINNWYFQS